LAKLPLTPTRKCNMKKDFTVYHALRTPSINIELRKHFDGKYSVVEIDKTGNEVQHIRDSYGKANAKYNVVLDKLRG
jgi:hypothetical protein